MTYNNNDSLEETGMRYSETAGGYSIFIPKDWEAVEFAGLKYKMLVGPIENDFRINFVFEAASFRERMVDASIEMWEKLFLEFELIQRSEFVTLKNLKCEKLETKSLQNKIHARQLVYYLYGNNGKVMIIVCTMHIKNGNVYDELIDKIINTFEWEADSERYKSIFNLNFRNNEKNLESLKQNLSNVVPFLGAGISKNYGYPLWDGLVKEIINVAENDKNTQETKRSISRARKRLEEKKYMDAIDELKDGVGSLGRFLEYIMSDIETKYKTRKKVIDNFGETLVLFPSKTYLTVNYDVVIENELIANSISKDNIEILTPHEFITKRSSIAENKFHVYHLHGVYTRPETLIFSKEDYNDFYGAERTALTNRFGDKMTELYAQYSFLFIGYSFNFYQDRLYDILQKISKNTPERCCHYAFLNTKSVEDLGKKEKELLGLKIKIVWYSAERDNDEQRQQAIKSLFNFIFNEKTSLSEVNNFSENMEKSTIEPFTELKIFDDIPLKYFRGDKYKFSLVVDKMGKYYVTDNGETYKHLDNIFELKEYDVLKNLTAIAKIYEKDNLSIEKYGQKESEYYIMVELKNKENDTEFNNEIEVAKYTLVSCVSFMDNMRIFYK